MIKSSLQEIIAKEHGLALPPRAEAGAEIVSGWPARVAGRSLAWLQNSFTRSESAPLRTKMHQDACSNCSFNDNCHPCRRPLSEFFSDVRSWRNCDRQRDAGSVRFQAAVNLIPMTEMGGYC